MNNIYYIWNRIDRIDPRLKRKPELPSDSFCSGIDKTGKMKEIKLRGGNVALVDDEDFEYLNKFKWSLHRTNKKYFYAERYVNLKTLSMHKFIMKTPKGMVVDHIDHNGLNNQKINLRNCLLQQNFLNRKASSSTGYLGVYKSGKKYIAQKIINGKVKHLGTFSDPKRAALEYDKMAKKINGEFANLNFK
jgi:hypothetical protein